MEVRLLSAAFPSARDSRRQAAHKSPKLQRFAPLARRQPPTTRQGFRVEGSGFRVQGDVGTWGRADAGTCGRPITVPESRKTRRKPRKTRRKSRKTHLEPLKTRRDWPESGLFRRVALMFRRPRQVFHGLKHKVCPARHVSGPTQHKVRPVRHLFAWMKRKDRPANLKGGGALLEKHAPRQARRPPRLPGGQGRPAPFAGRRSRVSIQDREAGTRNIADVRCRGNGRVSIQDREAGTRNGTESTKMLISVPRTTSFRVSALCLSRSGRAEVPAVRRPPCRDTCRPPTLSSTPGRNNG